MAHPSGTIGSGRAPPPTGNAAPCRLVRLTKRAEFLHVAKGKRFHGSALALQGARRSAEARHVSPGDVRFGFTVTRKSGSAVLRNRIRRRLKEALRLLPELATRPGYDYVILGRKEAARLPFAVLLAELDRGLRHIHREPAGRGGREASWLAPGSVAEGARRSARGTGRSVRDDGTAKAGC